MTGNASSSVIELNRNGMVQNRITDIDPETGEEIMKQPMGIAPDSKGNMWVANAGVASPPCPPNASGDDAFYSIPDEIGEDGGLNKNASITMISNEAPPEVKTFRKVIGGERDGLRWPWGIAVDGKDTIWVANFAGQRIMQLCGAVWKPTARRVSIPATQSHRMRVISVTHCNELPL